MIWWYGIIMNKGNQSHNSLREHEIDGGANTDPWKHQSWDRVPWRRSTQPLLICGTYSLSMLFNRSLELLSNKQNLRNKCYNSWLCENRHKRQRTNIFRFPFQKEMHYLIKTLSYYKIPLDINQGNKILSYRWLRDCSSSWNCFSCTCN